MDETNSPIEKLMIWWWEAESGKSLVTVAA
jgi:hypothetical protein